MVKGCIEMTRKQIVSLVVGLCLVITPMFFMGCQGDSVPADTALPQNGETPSQQEEEGLAGEPAEDPGETPEEYEIFEGEVNVEKVQPICVVINNIGAARPQSGLQEASIVYEFLVEGGITRLLAVYDTPHGEDYIIGPIRSLRSYFGHQAVEHGGIIAHGGYSTPTTEAIQGLGLRHITSSQYLWRDSSRKAPHNLYTHIEKLRRAAGGEDAIQRETVTVTDPPVDYERGLDIEISYSPHNKTTYTYHEESQSYLRFIDGSPHRDRETGRQYRARRVIIRKTSHQRVPGTELLDIKLVGKGSGYVYENGKKYPLQWEKKSGGETRFYYMDGTPVETRYGNTWIQVVPL